MATFSVFPTSLDFSTGHIYSGDITITDMPASGVNVSLETGTHFSYEMVSSNVIRVSSTGRNLLGSTYTDSLWIKTVGNPDDYIQFRLYQYKAITNTRRISVADPGDSFERHNLDPDGFYYQCGPDIGTDTMVVMINELAGEVQPLRSTVDWINFTFIGYSDGTGPGDAVTRVGYALYNVGCSVNNTGQTRTGYLKYAEGTVGSDTYNTIEIRQLANTPISASPSSLLFGDGGLDPQTVTISNATGTVSAQPSDSWITVTGSDTTWTVDVTTNVTSSERTGTVTFSDTSNSTTVSVWQDSPSPVADITVTPRTLSFSAEGGSGTLTVTYTDTLTTNISSFPSWLSMTETSSSEGEKTFSVTASQHDSTEGRSFVIEFSNGIHTVTATVNQGGHTSSFSVTPESFTFGKEGGTSTITLINPPSNAINWEFTYDEGSDWADLIFSTPTIGTITVTNNIGSRRTASLKIWNWDFPDDYIIIPITQYGEGFYAIWNDLPVSPSSFTQGEDYHYRISSGNTVLFEGITVPIDSGSLPVPVNIPRIVESYIHSGNPEDIVPDLVLHRLEGDLTVSLYDLEDPSSPVSEGSYSFWNDWSGVNEVYDHTVTLNDPINGRGCPGMIIPFCVCSDDGSSFSVDEGRPTGTVTHTLGVPQDHFSYAAAVFAAAGDVSLKDGDGNILTSYDMTHCGQGYLLYRNRYGGWDSFLIEGNIYSYDGYERLDAVYPPSKRKVTDRITIRTRYEIHTGWMNDEESGRLVYHLLSSPTVGLDIFGSPSGMIPVTVTVTQAEHKKFRNGRKMVSYTITLEENKDKTVQR